MGFTETIDSFVFREDGAITIPKRVREKAYTLQVDIKIVSVSKEPYENYSTNPPEGFFGYATSVFRDYCLPSVPINQARQTLYYGWVPEAYAMWNDFQLNNEAIERWKIQMEWFYAIGEKLEISKAPSDGGIQVFAGFTELPLREIYIRCPYGTQYEIEISYWEPTPFVDTNGDTQNGTSGQLDGDKDKGLPEHGTQPNKAYDPSNPYAGLPAPSSFEDKGDYANGKSGNLGEIDPNNNPIPEDAIWWLDVTTLAQNSNFPGACGVTRKQHITAAVAPYSTYTGYEQLNAGAANGCGGLNTPIKLKGAGGVELVSGLNPSITIGTEVTASIQFGTSFTAVNEITYV